MMHSQSTSPLPAVPGLMIDESSSPSPTSSYAMPSPPLAPLQFNNNNNGVTATSSSRKYDGTRLPSIGETLGDLFYTSPVSSTSNSDGRHHPHFYRSAMPMTEPRTRSVKTVRALTPSSPHLHGCVSSSSSPSDVSGCSHCHHGSSMTDTTMINQSTTTITTSSSITQSPLTHHHHNHHDSQQVTSSMSSSKNGTTTTTPSSMATYMDDYHHHPHHHHHMSQLPTPSPPSPLVGEPPLSPSNQSWMTTNTAAVALPVHHNHKNTGLMIDVERAHYQHPSTHNPPTTAMATDSAAAATAASPSTNGGVTFVANSGVSHKKRPRRRPEEIERLYTCNYPGCTKAYGTLNHLNAHVTMQRHGSKRLPSEFEAIRKQYRAMKLQQLQQHAMLHSATTSMQL